MRHLLAAVAVGLAVLVVHGGLSLALHGLAWTAARRGGPRWLPRLPLLAFGVVFVGVLAAVPTLVVASTPVGLVIGACVLATAWMVYGATVVLLLRRRL
ncbi:MAG: hypothetical protein MUE69_02370 [Myxococcota bacterium]|jgi:hypothetical protein|nr:hypothetical protein [Myxococcota bacterium]